MINKYVIGTPLDIRLNFWKKGNTGGSAKVVDVPCDISGYRRSVFYKTSKGVVNVEDSFCSGSTLTWQYKSTDQRITGIYTIVVILYNSDGSELIHQEFEGFGLIMPKYCNEPQPDRHIVRDAWVELYEFHPVIPEVSAITENWIVDGVDTGKVSRGNGWFAGTELTESNLSIHGTFSEIISKYGNILKKGDIYYNVNTSDVYRCESVTLSAIIQTSLWRKIANIKGKDFKYSDFTPEQIDGFMKPANDAAAIAREAAEKANSAAQQAKDEADKLPGIATNLQNAIDTAAATNSEIKSNESERLKSEQKRENSESTRVAAEQARASAEEQRKVNESERDMHEQTRQQQEQTRQQEFQSAEQSRQATFAASESARDTEFQSKESQRDAAMQTISQEAQKLTELEGEIIKIYNSDILISGGYIDATTGDVVSSPYARYTPFIDVRNTNFILVDIFGSTSSLNFGSAWYDEQYNLVSTISKLKVSGKLILEVPENVCYFRTTVALNVDWKLEIYRIKKTLSSLIDDIKYSCRVVTTTPHSNLAMSSYGAVSNAQDTYVIISFPVRKNALYTLNLWGGNHIRYSFSFDDVPERDKVTYGCVDLLNKRILFCLSKF